MCVLNSNLSVNILYLVTFTFKLAKHKMATKMLRKPRIFSSLSHMEAQFMFFATFLIDNFLCVSLKRKYIYLTLTKISAVFYVFAVTISILLNMLTKM